VFQGYFKVLGKGELPTGVCIVRAKEFSATAEKRIREKGGRCELIA
jgi:large subunit ribosomal protein L27Ae